MTVEEKTQNQIFLSTNLAANFKITLELSSQKQSTDLNEASEVFILRIIDNSEFNSTKLPINTKSDCCYFLAKNNALNKYYRFSLTLLAHGGLGFTSIKYVLLCTFKVALLPEAWQIKMEKRGGDNQIKAFEIGSMAIQTPVLTPLSFRIQSLYVLSNDFQVKNVQQNR